MRDTYNTNNGKIAAIDGSLVRCACPSAFVAERKAAEEERTQLLAEERERNRVLANSCLRGDDCNDAGAEQEAHTDFTRIAFYQTIPPRGPGTPSLHY